MSIAFVDHVGPWTIEDVERRLELEDRPHLIASKLSNGKFRRTITAVGGVVSTVDDPFPLRLDPAALTRA